MKKKRFKAALVILAISFLVLSLNSPVFASCSAGSSWTAGWTDPFGQTTYSLQAPCTAYVGVPFAIVSAATDTFFPNSMVGGVASIKDNGSAIASFSWITLSNGLWQRTTQQTYTGSLTDHNIEFKFTDFGQGSGGHNWATGIIGGITVGPYPSNTPPTVDAGPNIWLLSENQNTTVIHGTASDAEGDVLSCRWLEGTVELQSWQLVDSLGNAPLNLALVAPLPLGSHTLTLEVNDGTTTVVDTVIVTVENSAPVAAPSTSGTFLLGQDIRLNGSVADYDGDNLTYTWLEGTTVLAGGTIQAVYGGAPVALPEHILAGGLPLGDHTLTLRVSDGIQTVSTDTSVTVIDTQAPIVTPTVSTNILWPPNGTMTTVTINTNAVDNSGGAVMLSVLVTSNEPSKTDKDGNIIPDMVVLGIDQATGVITLQLRASRTGNGGDRLYYVTITATDESGNSTVSQVIIRAPHDMGHS